MSNPSPTRIPPRPPLTIRSASDSRPLSCIRRFHSMALAVIPTFPPLTDAQDPDPLRLDEDEYETFPHVVSSAVALASPPPPTPPRRRGLPRAGLLVGVRARPPRWGAPGGAAESDPSADANLLHLLPDPLLEALERTDPLPRCACLPADSVLLPSPPLSDTRKAEAAREPEEAGLRLAAAPPPFLAVLASAAAAAAADDEDDDDAGST